MEAWGEGDIRSGGGIGCVSRRAQQVVALGEWLVEVSRALIDPHEDTTVAATAAAGIGGRRPSLRRLRRSLSTVSASGCGSGYGLWGTGRPVTAAQRFDYFVNKVGKG